jgi:hypothetical protein
VLIRALFRQLHVPDELRIPSTLHNRVDRIVYSVIIERERKYFRMPIVLVIDKPVHMLALLHTLMLQEGVDFSLLNPLVGFATLHGGAYFFHDPFHETFLDCLL